MCVKVSCEEEIDWIPVSEQTYDVPSLEELKSWMKLDKKTLTIENAVEFVEPDILEQVLSVSNTVEIESLAVEIFNVFPK